MAYRKKRIRPAENKNAAKALRRQENQNQAPLDHRYPVVQRLAIGLNFYTPRGEFLEKKNLVFTPQDQVDFRVPCPGTCGDGRIDLETKVDEVINKRETLSQGRGKCAQPVYAGENEDVCGYELHCNIEVNYR